MAGKKTTERQLNWQDVIKRQAESGLSVRQFCTKEQVSEPSFYAWRRKLVEARPDGKRTVMSSRRVSTPKDGQDFIPLKLIETVSAMEVVHPRGYRIRVTGEVNVTDLQRVLDVLDGRSDG